MNNCPKCGNPLQDGVTSCPICGTNISSSAETSVAEPAAPAPVQPTVEPPAAAPAQPVEPAPVATAEPAPVSEPAPVEAAEPAPIEPAPIQPTVEPPAETPVAQTPVSEPAPAVSLENVVTPVEKTPEVTQPAAPAAPAQPEIPRKKKNKLLPVLLVLIIAASGVAVYFNMPKKTTTPGNNQKPTTQISMSDVTSHGYKFKIPEGWVVRENNDDVIIVNDNETVYVKLDHSDDNIDTLTKETIENYLKTKTTLTDTSVESNTINANPTFIINGKNNGTPAQIFFIGAGSDLILGVAVSYQTEDSKTINEAAVQEIIGTISYSNDSMKAIEIINMYSELFGTYKGVINAKNTPVQVEPEEPAEPETPETPEVPDDPEKKIEEVPTDPETPEETPGEPTTPEEPVQPTTE